MFPPFLESSSRKINKKEKRLKGEYIVVVKGH